MGTARTTPRAERPADFRGVRADAQGADSEGAEVICLNMIVKDEAHCIARCLRSVRPYIDAAYICDTGSTDETKIIACRELAGLPYHYGSIPWEGFGPSRTRAAAEASRWGVNFDPPKDEDARLLLMDADQTLEGDLPAFVGDVGYCRTVGADEIETTKALLIRADKPWKFEPITHETLMPDGDWVPTNAFLRGVTVRQHNDSARRKSGEKYTDDVRLLRGWLGEHPDDARAWVYLGISLRGAGDLFGAGMALEKCVQLGPGQYAAWASLLQGHILEGKGDPVRAYLLAYRLDPSAAEPLGALAQHYMTAGDFLTAELYARQACALPEPETGPMFLDRSVYRWKRWALLGQALCAVGRLDEAREVMSVDRGEPPEEKARIAAGLAWIREKAGC